MTQPESVPSDDSARPAPDPSAGSHPSREVAADGSAVDGAGAAADDRTSDTADDARAEVAAGAGHDQEADAAGDARAEEAAGSVDDPEVAPRPADLAGLAVEGSDGGAVGRIRDVYLHDATGALAAIVVVRRQLSSRQVLLPAEAIASLPRTDRARHGEEDAAPSAVVRLRIDAATARTGLRPPATLHATPAMLAEAARAVGLEGAPPA